MRTKNEKRKTKIRIDTKVLLIPLLIHRLFDYLFNIIDVMMIMIIIITFHDRYHDDHQYCIPGMLAAA